MSDGIANFVRLAEARTQKLLNNLEWIDNLSNQSNYCYSEDDVKLIFGAINKNIQDTALKFKVSLDLTRATRFEFSK
jgi:hypothetical protein